MGFKDKKRLHFWRTGVLELEPNDTFTERDITFFNAKINEFSAQLKERDIRAGASYGSYGQDRHIKDRYADTNTLDGMGIRVSAMYEKARVIAEGISGQQLLSFDEYPFDRKAAINFKEYSRVGDEHGGHFETNCMTLIVSLSDCESGEFFHCGINPQATPETKRTLIKYRYGSAVLLRGLDVFHGSEPIRNEGDVKRILVFNLYTLEPNRPDGLDNLHYGKADR